MFFLAFLIWKSWEEVEEETLYKYFNDYQVSWNLNKWLDLFFLLSGMFFALGITCISLVNLRADEFGLVCCQINDFSNTLSALMWLQWTVQI